jgi:hypothetical protein
MLVVGCYQGKSLLSRKIKWETNSPISHVSLLQLPDALWHPADGLKIAQLHQCLHTCPVYEAWGVLNPFSRAPSGVLRRQGINEGHTPGTRVDLMRIAAPVSAHTEQAIINTLDALVSSKTPYDWLGLLRYKLRINRDNLRRMHCSKLAHWVLSHHGVHLIRRRAPHKTAPGDIYISPALHLLWTVKTT